MDANLRINFDRAWQLRLNQKLDEALIAYAALKDPVRMSSDWQCDVELRILNASLLRARGEIVNAETAIKEIEQDCNQKAQPLPSRLLVEKGLNAFYRENYSQAFDDFLNVVARGASETNLVMLAQATLSALLCTEYLGLSPISLEKNYKETRSKIDKDLNLPGLDSQWQAYQLRGQWAFGRFEQIQAPIPPKWNQATYHLHFLKSLPFINHESFPGGDLTEALKSQPEPYLRSYWLRTLTGQSRDEDLQVNKISESAERVYLWTWYWLAGREMQLEKIVPYFELLLNNMSKLHLTQLDQELVSLSLSWLSLFSPNFETLKDKMLTQFSTVRSSTILPFMEYERLILSCVENKLRGTFSPNDEFVKMISLHPLHQSKFHDFGKIFNSLDDLDVATTDRISGFINRIRQRVKEEHDFQRSEIAVDLEKMVTINKTTGEKINSESICEALRLLSESQSVSCSEFLETVFQQRGYDDYLHSPRIFNLLARIRAFLPESLQVTKKGDRVLTKGNWAIVKIKKPPERVWESQRASTLLTATQAPSFEKRKIKGYEKLLKIDRPRFNRKDVENKLHLSRAAANRLVKEWLENGLVESLGSGPSRKYVLSEKWRVMNS